MLFNEVLAKLHGDNDKNVQAVFENSECRGAHMPSPAGLGV